ncbi:Membrane alanine aminopeptidase N [Microbacterium esteraromaticum]|uniref:Aminopeptidase N n=1 Tax=Microbacterium esteraromaticum TaxID=57043 RepID=A0A1R4JNG7_9MICO|nr:aminopeptidase N [Microbacterium esteraromaticum]SJN33512.1 Membrane alanine aminopeptidase N [Microbacterium esteraromaticum]
MSSANLTREETARRAGSITLRDIRVELDLTGAPERARTGFPTITTLSFDAREGETWVDFIGESVSRVVVNDEDRDVRYDGARILIDGLTAQNTVRIEAIAAYSRSGEGMHRFHDPVDGETYLYTQYEPADSRRVMACFEQPDMKAAFTFDVTAPAGWHVLSNQSPARVHEGIGMQRVEFEPTLPISSYITSVAAGPYARLDGEWRRDEQQIALGVLCRASLAEYLEGDEIIEITRQGLDFFTDAFAYPYPWGKYDQIFVPEYNLGAMENPGLVTFTEAYISRGAATDAQRGARANTLLHEMAHMWFGDLVTMRWWDDLWLKESFADYMGAHASAAATRFTDAWARFANSRKTWAYRQDQLPTTHPIVADIPDLEAAKLNFDGITYAKGAAVLKQLVAFVGEDAFFEGARRYFAAHAFGNTTLDDLLDELEAVSGEDLRAWSRAWLETSGVSALWLETDAEGRRFLVQDSGEVAPRPHRLRIGLYDQTESGLRLRERIELGIHEERTEVEIPDADLTVLNDDDLTYAKVRLDERSLASVTESLSTLTDDLVRGLIWSSLWNATRDGELPVERYLEIVRRHAPAEPNVALLSAVLLNAAFAVHHYTRDDGRAAARRTWVEATWSALQSADAGSDAQLSWARAFATASAYDDAFAENIKAILGGEAPQGLPIDADLRWLLLTALAATGHAGAEEIAVERKRDDTATGRTAEICALSSRPDAEIRAAAWATAWGDLSLSNDHLDATIAGFRAGGRRDLIDAFDAEYFSRLRAVWAERSIELARRLVIGLFPASDSTDDVDAWLSQNADAPGALRRIVIEQRDDLARELRVRAAQD